ncbi:hypothetical protein DDE20_18595 [Pararhodobacter oceanensis]|uniref:Peptidase S1 n=2 Tax=Pararhodobacter oceanensis TaxID=2172121 RepID=A0A2T8HPB3_9RHOB|nr:hypothetical protein DDE20_18595 [Pararhodobacter oceanensis]
MDAETAWSPQSYHMHVGGMLNLSQCGEVPGRGHVTAAPNMSINYDARSMGRDLEFRVESQCDTTLLINTASAGWEFSDDEGSGLNALVRLSDAPSGRYDLWVGTYSGEACQATLIAETFPSGAVSSGSAACPDWSLGGTQINSNAGQTSSHQMIAGGQVNLHENSCDTNGYGFVAQAPDFSLYFDAMGQSPNLTLSANGDCDEVLLINDYSANWLFNDDAGSLHPSLTIANASSGRYDVWVGTYGSSTCASTLTVSSSGAAASGQVPAAPGK